MTLKQALEILNKYDGTEMTDEQYYEYHCAQNKITRLILSGEYKLVKTFYTIEEVFGDDDLES